MLKHSKACLLIITLSALLISCDAVDTVKSGISHAQAVSTTIESETSLKSVVNFQWSNGRLNSVTVNFQEITENITIKDLAEITQQAVAHEFKQKPDHLIISFELN